MQDAALTDSLLHFFQHHPATGYLLAFSGGMDSHVLLHACASLRTANPALRFRAIHIDHGLQAVSADWAVHCRAVCQALNLPLACENLHLQVPAGASLEAVARDARYAVFSQHLQAGEMLLTAHHQNDQAETLLLHLVRGSGVDGLAAMPEVRPFARGALGRPLLACSRAALVAYANQHRLNGIDDPSNQDTRFDRNFLRHQVMPMLEQRWPAVRKTLARAARLQGESRQLLEGFLREKLGDMQGSRVGTLSVSKLLGQDVLMRKALVREWLAQRRFLRPEEKKLLHVLHDVLESRPDAKPCVRWEGCEIRRYRDDVYALSPLLAHDATQVLAWDGREPFYLPGVDMTLQPELLGDWQSSDEPITVRFRQGGESVWMPQRGGYHSLKNVLQEAGVPPWQRERLPLVYVGERLVWVVGLYPLRP